MTISVRWAARTDLGRRREKNEDSLIAQVPVFAVADGMGGVAGGDVASAMTVARLEPFAGSAVVDTETVLAAVQHANADVFRERHADAARSQMGATVSGIALTRADGADALLVFNVGDSRVYRSRSGIWAQLTTDHSVVAELVASGKIQPEEASTHPERNVVTRVVGGSEGVEVDSWVIEPEVGDRYVVCTDGLTGEVLDADIVPIVADAESPGEVVEALVDAALEAGGRDNVSVVAIDILAVDVVATALDDDTDPNTAGRDE